MLRIPYIHFTEEQKQRASSVDLVEFLRQQGEKLLPSGREKRLGSDHSITVNGNRWYDHSAQQGGGAISFVQKFYGVGYAEAVTRLLGDEQGETYQPVKQQAREPPKPQQPFALPDANPNMRRVFAYLTKKRLIGSKVVNAFAEAGLLYESCEKFNNMEQHNAVFVGKDEHGIARHAHKRGLGDQPFKRNVIGSDARCSFHYTGTSRRLYVFEAPIDLMSFVTLYQKDWQKHSYVALCGTSEHAMLWMLEQNPKLQRIALCLDHDPAGITAIGRLREILHDKGYRDIAVGLPQSKDWNSELFACCGKSAEPGEKHPQMLAAPSICERIAGLAEKANARFAAQQIPPLLKGYERNLQAGRFEQAMERMESAAAFALTAALRERRQLRAPVAESEVSAFLQGEVWPNQNQSALKGRSEALLTELQSVMTKAAAQGIRTQPEKEAIADAWLHLAASCTKVVVKYEADAQEQQQAQQQIEMGVKLC